MPILKFGGRSRLVLSRRKGDVLDIGTDVSVTVLAITGNSVRLAIEAPRRMPIYRRELTLLAAKIGGPRP